MKINSFLYIGKSNKKYTYNNVYKFYGSIYQLNIPVSPVTIFDNKNIPHIYTTDYMDYVIDNFKIIDEDQFKQHMRKLKLNRISNLNKKKR